jgi:hypothetical protein
LLLENKELNYHRILMEMRGEKVSVTWQQHWVETLLQV